MSYGEVLGDISTMYISVTLYWGYLIVLWIFNLVCTLYCGCFNLFCDVLVFSQLCGCFGNICARIYCVLYFLYCVFVLFRLCIFILNCYVCTSVRTTATEWKLNCSNNNNNDNNNNLFQFTRSNALCQSMRHTQFLICAQFSFWYYRHPNFFPSILSFSESKMIFSKDILNFPFNPPSKYDNYFNLGYLFSSNSASQYRVTLLCLIFVTVLCKNIPGMWYSVILYFTALCFYYLHELHLGSSKFMLYYISLIHKFTLPLCCESDNTPSFSCGNGISFVAVKIMNYFWDPPTVLSFIHNRLWPNYSYLVQIILFNK